MNTCFAILNTVAGSSTGNVTAAAEVADGLATGLAEATKAVLRVLTKTKTGTVTFKIAGIAGSYDGTNFVTVETFTTPITIAAEGEQSPRQLNFPLVGLKKIKLVLSDDTVLDDTHKFEEVTAQILAVFPQL